MLNAIILTQVKLKSINYVALPTRTSNHLRGDVTRLGAMYIFDNAHYEILETIFQGKN